MTGTLCIPILGLDIISHGLWVLVWLGVVVTVPVIIVVVIISGPKVIHLVDTTALWAALNGTVTGDREPDSVMRIGRMTGTTKVSIGRKDIRNRAPRWFTGLNAFIRCGRKKKKKNSKSAFQGKST